MSSSPIQFDAPALMTDGICRLDNPYPASVIDDWNARLDPIFAAKQDQARAEVGGDQLYDLGIFDGFFSPEMRFVLRSLMPDAVLFDFHAYEIAANQDRSHILSERLDGWHPDIKPLPGMDMRVPHFISFFVYLTDVTEVDGAFELLPLSSQEEFRSGLSSIKAVGPKGTAFVWNKSFYHRASPNHGSIRRRLLKVTFHRNYFENVALNTDWCVALREKVGDRDAFLAYVLGRFHKETHLGGHYLPEVPGRRVGTYQFSRNSRIERFGLADELRLFVKRLLKVSA